MTAVVRNGAGAGAGMGAGATGRSRSRVGLEDRGEGVEEVDRPVDVALDVDGRPFDRDRPVVRPRCQQSENAAIDGQPTRAQHELPLRVAQGHARKLDRAGPGQAQPLQLDRTRSKLGIDLADQPAPGR